MSYAYLFKYIVIGDTGASAVPRRAASPRRAATTRPRSRYAADRTERFSRRRGEVVPAPAVHRQDVSTRARPDDRRRVRVAHGERGEQTSEIADLGHGAKTRANERRREENARRSTRTSENARRLTRSRRARAGGTRELSKHHEELLSRRGGGAAGVRRDAQGDVR